jgi:hypothetical protein
MAILRRLAGGVLIDFLTIDLDRCRTSTSSRPAITRRSRGFAAAGRADKDDEFAVLNVEVDALQDFVIAEGLADGFQLK